MEAVLRKELEAAAASSNALRLTEERRKGPSTQPLGVVEVEWACNLMTTVREHRARLHQCQLELRAVEPLEKAQDDLVKISNEWDLACENEKAAQQASR